MRRRSLWLPALAAFLLLAAGCADDVSDPGGNGADRCGALIDGSLDPGDGSFVLKMLDAPPPSGGEPRPVELIGSDLVADPDRGTVSLRVALRNPGDTPLFGPVTIWLHDFQPPEVVPLDADFGDDTAAPDSTRPPARGRWGYDYSALLGGDGVLDPGETGEPRTWTFHDPGQVPFGFGAEAEFGLVPGLPRLGGICFLDVNRDGVPQQDEPPAPVFVSIRFPDGHVVQVNGPPARMPCRWRKRVSTP